MASTSSESTTISREGRNSRTLPRFLSMQGHKPNQPVDGPRYCPSYGGNPMARSAQIETEKIQEIAQRKKCFFSKFSKKRETVTIEHGSHWRSLLQAIGHRSAKTYRKNGPRPRFFSQGVPELPVQPNTYKCSLMFKIHRYSLPPSLIWH